MTDLQLTMANNRARELKEQCEGMLKRLVQLHDEWLELELNIANENLRRCTSPATASPAHLVHSAETGLCVGELTRKEL